MSYSLTFLGTGTSHGIPVIGCCCKTCKSKNPKNKRFRSSILLQKDNQNIVIDTGPDFRLQALRSGLNHLEAVLYTHSHADHLNGIDDLRTFSTMERNLPVFASKNTMEDIENRFAYVFSNSQTPSSIPRLAPNVLEPYKKIDIAGFDITPLEIYHGDLKIFGYKIFNTAYLTDCNYIPEKTLEYLKDLDLLIIVALQHNIHNTHYNLSQAVEVSKQIGAKQTYFTHIAHGLNHEVDNIGLPDNMALAYDNLKLKLEEK